MLFYKQIKLYLPLFSSRFCLAQITHVYTNLTDQEILKSSLLYAFLNFVSFN